MKTRIIALIAALALSLGIGLSATSASAAAHGVLKNSTSSAGSVTWKTATSSTLLYVTPGYQTTNAVFQFKIPSGCSGTATSAGVSGIISGGTWYLFNTYAYGASDLTVRYTC